MEPQILYFKCKPNQWKNMNEFALMSTKKDPDPIDIIPNAMKCYGDASKVIVCLLINGHGVKSLHKRFYKFDDVEDPTPEEQAKMDKFAAVKEKNPKDYKLDDYSMDDIGIKADYLGTTPEEVFAIYPDLDGTVQSGVNMETGEPIMVPIFKPGNWAL